jgi:ABC-type multidrug transport system fused ATPase/permease subunit
MIDTIRKALTLLDQSERWKLVVLLLFAGFNGLAQIAGIGSVMPFIGVLTNPGLVTENAVLRWVHAQLGAPSVHAFLLMLGGAVLVTFVLSNIFVAFTQWFTYRFSQANQYRLSMRLFEAYLRKPYAYHIQHNSADIGKNILTETQTFTQQVLLAGLQAIGFSVAALFIMGFLIWLNPLVAAAAVGIIGGGYGLIYFVLRVRLRQLGRNRLRANTGRFKVANETFGAIKEIKVAGRERAFLDRYGTDAKRFADAMAAHQIMRNLPRHLVEIVGLGSVLLMVLLLVAVGYETTAIAPLVGVYVVAGHRLFPCFQHIYLGVSGLRADGPVVHALYADLSNTRESGDHRRLESPDSLEKLPFRNTIELQNLTFTFPGADYPALRGVSLNIPCGTSVAFVGETGAGKTTLADVIIGLLPSQKGRILVDGVELTENNLRRWRASIGYVPQHIYLMDDTIARNIAFGIPDSKIDQAAVEQAARIANIHDFVTNELPDGYNTIVGERGIRLSGGQRQRIGIARALYHDPELLILDEATSALDNATEDAVQKAIDQAAEAKTLVIIAHRLSTVRNCDLVYVLKKGRVVAQGNYETLLDGSPQFRALALAKA